MSALDASDRLSLGRSFGADTKEKAPRLPFLALAAVLTMLTPAYFFAGPLSLSPSRLLFLAIVPMLLINLFRGMYGRFLVPDGLILAYSFWMTVAIFVNHTPRVALEYTGSNIVTLLGGYLTARATIRSKHDFRALTRLFVLVVLISLPFALYETVTSRTTIPRWLAALPGISSHQDINHDPRLGLWRVQWVFVHPIHYGLFCSLAFSMYFIGMGNVIGFIRRFIVAFLVALCCFLSVSSGPVLALGCQMGLIGWQIVTNRIKNRWRLFSIMLILLYIPIEIASDRPGLYALVERLSFSPDTAYVRRILFNYGMAQIGRTPIFGVGFNEWELPYFMTGSVDNFWLLLALVFGVPAFLFFAGAFLTTMISAGRRNFDADPDLIVIRRSWMFTVSSLILTMATVAVWAEMYSLVLFMLGAGVWMMYTNPDDDTSADNAEDDTAPKPASPYTRFAWQHSRDQTTTAAPRTHQP